jgi:hypothetical protein
MKGVQRQLVLVQRSEEGREEGQEVIPRTADLDFEGRQATAPFSLRLDNVTAAAGNGG